MTLGLQRPHSQVVRVIQMHYSTGTDYEGVDPENWNRGVGAPQ